MSERELLRYTLESEEEELIEAITSEVLGKRDSLTSLPDDKQK